MATLTIRNLDPETVERLKARAKAHNRSLEAEVRDLITASANTPDWASFRREAERIAAKTAQRPQTDSVELIREDRDIDSDYR